MRDLHMDAKVLRRAAEIVEQGWCQHSYALVASKPTMDALSPRADRWCFWGALDKAAVEVLGAKVEFIGGTTAATRLGGGIERALGVQSVARWNDAPERTADEVAAALRAAAARCDGRPHHG